MLTSIQLESLLFIRSARVSASSQASASKTVDSRDVSEGESVEYQDESDASGGKKRKGKCKAVKEKTPAKRPPKKPKVVVSDPASWPTSKVPASVQVCTCTTIYQYSRHS